MVRQAHHEFTLSMSKGLFVLSKRTGRSYISLQAILFFLAFTSSCLALFDYERAIIQTQKNNWPAAQDLLTTVIVENPERPDVLYDLGVASYKNNNFDAALSYFNKAAHHAQANLPLQQQAHFNAGNAHVQLKQLHEAIEAYDRVLAQQPDHKQALHNKEVVKKMLEQSADDKSMADKQKQEQQDKNQEENKEQDKDSSDDKSKEDKQDKNDKNQKDQQSAHDKSMADRDKQQKNKEDSKNQDQNKKVQDKNKDQSNADKSQEQKDESGSEQKKQSCGQQDKDQSAGAKAQADKQNGATTQADQKPGQENPEQKLSAGLARVLDDREKKDAQLNKKMTKALVANQGGSKNDYNCW